MFQLLVRVIIGVTIINISSKAVVDVFLLYQNGFVANNSYSVHPQYSWLAAPTYKLNPSFNNSNARVHIIGNLKIISKAKGDLTHGFEVVDIEKFHGINKMFKHMYKHRSVNNEGYEYWCFLRWLISYEYAISRKDLNISTVIIADNDVIIYEDIQNFVNRLMSLANHKWNSSTDFDTIVVLPGALNVFSIAGLKAHAKYLIDLYSLSTDEFDKYVERYGTKKYSPDMFHLSDMYTLLVFLGQDKSRRKHVKLDRPNTCSIHCEPRSVHFIDGFPYSSVQSVKTNSSVQSVKTNSSVQSVKANSSVQSVKAKCCFLHFQGKRKNLIEDYVAKLSRNFSDHV